MALAADLEARGYSVWWDTSLLPGDEFPDIIKRRIDEAKAVIVIWTAHSVASKWVRAEAVRADDQDKLITVSAPGLSYRDIPMPFNTRHCEHRPQNTLCFFDKSRGPSAISKQFSYGKQKCR